jgi:hypothetical protein
LNRKIVSSNFSDSYFSRELEYKNFSDRYPLTKRYRTKEELAAETLARKFSLRKCLLAVLQELTKHKAWRVAKPSAG